MGEAKRRKALLGDAYGKPKKEKLVSTSTTTTTNQRVEKLGDYYRTCLKEHGKGYVVITHAKDRKTGKLVEWACYTLLSNPSVPQQDREIVQNLDQSKFLIYIDLFGYDVPSSLVISPWELADKEKESQREIVIARDDIIYG